MVTVVHGDQSDARESTSRLARRAVAPSRVRDRGPQARQRGRHPVFRCGMRRP
jgi:hypothetical protein